MLLLSGPGGEKEQLVVSLNRLNTRFFSTSFTYNTEVSEYYFARAIIIFAVSYVFFNPHLRDGLFLGIRFLLLLIIF